MSLGGVARLLERELMDHELFEALSDAEHFIGHGPVWEVRAHVKLFERVRARAKAALRAKLTSENPELARALEEAEERRRLGMISPTVDSEREESLEPRHAR